MKRRGFLGSLVTLVAGSALAGKAEQKVAYEVIDKVAIDKEKLVFVEPEQPKWIASGMVPEMNFAICANVDGPVTIQYADGTWEYYTEERHAQLMGLPSWPGASER